jgi:transcription antitermination factor NusG
MCWSLRPDRVTPSLKHRVQRPLFGSYLFVVPGAHWAPIAHTRGVLRLLMANGRPGIVPDAAVEALRGVQGSEPSSVAWAPGTPCSLVLGPLRGHPAVVLAVDGSSATISVLIFGGLRPVSAPVAWLVARE